MEQLHWLVGYLCRGGDRVNLNRTAPQWQLPECELLSPVGVGGNVMLNQERECGLARYSLELKDPLTDALTPAVAWFNVSFIGPGH